MTETYLDKSKTNYNGARDLYKLKVTDEAYVNLVGYFLQQAAELGIKYIYDIIGISYPKSNDISNLINNLPKQYRKYTKPLEEYSYTLTKWNTDTRYKKGFRSNVIDIEKSFKALDVFYSCVETLDCNADNLNSKE